MAEETTSHNRTLVGVVQFASALSLGTLAAVLYSVKMVTPQIRFGFSSATLVAFVVAAAASIAFWHVVFHLNDSPNTGNAAGSTRKRWFRILAALLGIGLVFGFAYPLRGFSQEKLSEIGFGSIVAVAFLTVLALIFWRVVRYLEHESRG